MGELLMTNVICEIDLERLPVRIANTVPVLMYGASPPSHGSTSIGGPVMAEVRRLGVRVPQTSFDFLTVAMAVTAADTFVQRERAAADGWTRELRVVVQLGDPVPWVTIVPLLEQALQFLSGDKWTIEVKAGGPVSPIPQSRGRVIRLDGHNCACLFSGGLDSTIGVLDLIADGHRPVLVSHAYRGDKSRQYEIWVKLPTRVSRFAANANPRSNTGEPNDVTMRTRSFNFLAYGVVVASAMERIGIPPPVRLVVPENGLIALNPPLTPRRIGALSTRTTHPHFLGLMQQVFDGLGLPVTIDNPYNEKTKGEMIRECRNLATLAQVFDRTVSCGKWKRKGIQCGRCVPCLIRRASFHAAAMADKTDYRFDDLHAVMANDNERDDLLAMAIAVRRAKRGGLGSWVAMSGPLPTDRTKRDALVNVFGRGMREMHTYLDSMGLLR
jgi:hypothetical protein